VKALELYKTLATQCKADDNFRIGKEYYEGSENLKKDTTIGYIYLSVALDGKNNGLDDYLADINYFGEGYKKYPKTALDLIMALEKKCSLGHVSLLLSCNCEKKNILINVFFFLFLSFFLNHSSQFKHFLEFYCRKQNYICLYTGFDCFVFIYILV
jgi:hypothetical protein